MYLFVIYFLLCAGAWRMTKKRSVGVETMCFLLFLIFFVLRFNQGPDTLSYVGAFFRVSHPIKDAFMYHTQRNVGFNLLLYIGKNLLGNYRNFAIMMNVLMMGITGWVIYRYSNNKLLSCAILLGSGVIEMYYSSGMRQMMAMCIFFFGYYALYQKGKIWQYELTALLAVLFHECAVVALFVPLMIYVVEKFRNADKKRIFMAVIVFVFCFAVINVILPTAAFYMNDGTPLMHMLSYFTEKNFSVLGVGLEGVLLGLVILLYRFADRRQIEVIDTKTRNLMIGVLVMYLLFVNYSIISRVCDFIQILLIIYMPNMLLKTSDARKRVFLGVCIVGLNGFLLYSDMSFKVSRLNHEFDKNYSVIQYPLDTVFDEEAVNFYVHIVE